MFTDASNPLQGTTSVLQLIIYLVAVILTVTKGKTLQAITNDNVLLDGREFKVNQRTVSLYYLTMHPKIIRLDAIYS